MMKQLILTILMLALMSVPSPAQDSAHKAPPGMVWIPGGTFMMGADPGEGYEVCRTYRGDSCDKGWFSDESPRHAVTVDGFYMDRTEVTQAEFERVMGTNPSQFKAPSRPVEKVAWAEAKIYCEKLGKRLPTEAEWEKAARGGSTARYYWGDEPKGGYANFCDTNCEFSQRVKAADDGYATTAPVGSYKANEYGLYDMAGNVWEWIADWYDGKYYQQESVKNPKGPSSGQSKVLRGGSWSGNPNNMRTANRNWNDPSRRYSLYGFRCSQYPPTLEK